MLLELRTRRRWTLAMLVLAAAALFLLLHPYLGMVHDARLYTMQALSHLHPELYRNDVFVRFGSQDDYTLFSPLYAQVVSLLGIEPAAAIVSFTSICLFLGSAWILGRTLLTPHQALVGVILLIVVPSYYGPSRIFHFLEEFVTPRQLAEALTLFCLSAWFSRRRLLATALAICAILIHPIMGFFGLAFLAVLEVLLPHWRKLWPLLAAALLLAGLALTDWLPLSRWQFDSQWYDVVIRRNYLGLQYWNSDDWGRIATVFATLGAAGLLLQDNLRRIALAALVTTALLLILAAVGGDLLRIVVVVQAQPWRVLWLASVLALLLLAPMFVHVWRNGPLARCALILIAAGWSAAYATPALVAAPLAVIAATFASRPVPKRAGNLLIVGAWGALALVVIDHIATALLSWHDGLTQVDSLPPLLDELLAVSRSGLLPLLVVAAAAFVALRAPSRMILTGLIALVSVSIAMLIPPTLKTWTNSRYPQALRDSYAGWRERIPPGSDVMWVSEDAWWGDGATNTWLLLQRPSFVSNTQAPNALFSRAAALEMSARVHSLWGLLSFTDPFRPKGRAHSSPSGKPRLAPICQAGAARYLVTRETMIDAEAIPAPAAAPLQLRDYKLYICS